MIQGEKGNQQQLVYPYFSNMVPAYLSPNSGEKYWEKKEYKKNKAHDDTFEILSVYR